MFPKHRKLFILFILTGFLAGMSIGVFAKTENENLASNLIFSLLIFSTGISIGAFITRLQNEFKLTKSNKSNTANTC